MLPYIFTIYEEIKETNEWLLLEKGKNYNRLKNIYTDGTSDSVAQNDTNRLVFLSISIVVE